jgi:hypothetical protein
MVHEAGIGGSTIRQERPSVTVALLAKDVPCGISFSLSSSDRRQGFFSTLLEAVFK